jgi:Flp pilus assembly protein TadG
MRAKRHAGERGSNIIEAALVIPLLLMLLASVVDLGRAYFTYITIIDVAREGARYGSNHPKDGTTAIFNKALAEMQGQPVLGTLQCTVTTNTGVVGTPLRVRVSSNFNTYLGGFVGRPTFPMSYEVAYRIWCEGGTC